MQAAVTVPVQMRPVDAEQADDRIAPEQMSRHCTEEVAIISGGDPVDLQAILHAERD